MRPSVLIFPVCYLFAVASALAGTAPSWLSERGLYRLSYDSQPTPVVINRMHAWVLHIETADGEPVDGAAIAVSGSMPAHRHGLPTRPRIVAELGNGAYRLEGLRFHMPGTWEIVVTIDAGDGADSVVVPLEL